MRKLACFLLVMSILVFGPSLPRASAEGSAEVELIVDYLNQLQVTIILPLDVDPTSLATQVSSIVNSPLNLRSDWETAEGLHVWLYAAPKLMKGAGLQKSALWDVTGLAAVANQSGLSEGVQLFLVVNQPNGALSYNVYVTDQGTELDPVAADQMEIWWGFGLKSGGGAPKLSVLLWVKPLLNWLTLSPLWIPLFGLLLLWPLLRSKRRFVQRLSGYVCWLIIWSSVLVAFLMQWQAVGNSLFGSTDGLSSRITFFLTFMIPFVWSYLVVRLPLYRRMTRELKRPWSAGRYLRASLRPLALLAVLLVLGQAWLALAQYLLTFGLWLTVISALFTAALLLWLTNELMPVVNWGRRPNTDGGAEAMICSLSGRLQIAPPELHFIPVDQVNQANAFAAGVVKPRVYLTRRLWDNLPPAEQRFILAHELAHIKRRDSLRFIAQLLVPIWLLVVAAALVVLIDAVWPLTLTLGLLLLATMVIFYLVMPSRRRAELAADALALQATGDLTAAVSALRRVQSINQTESSRTNRLTHPALEMRIAAMSQAAGNPKGPVGPGGN